jgi:outer membrane lipoprotein carrier protein
MSRLLFIAFASLLVTLSTGAVAQSLDAVKLFRNLATELKSGDATFEQTVFDRNGKPTNRVNGTLQFSKPGKFKWHYGAPTKQQIVGNGKKVWLFDEDLKQVTVQAQDKAINSGPAAIFAGQAEIDATFDLRAIGELDNLQWVEAKPKVKDAGFEYIRVGLKVAGGQSEPSRIELVDNFGNKTQLSFKTFKKNSKVANEVFDFVPPKGVDVLGE